MNNTRDKFEAWAKPYYTEQQMSLNSAEHFARPNEYMMTHYQSAYEGWQAASEQSQKEIEALQAREKELVEAISSSLNCIREEINLNNYTETLLGDFISDYGDMVIILQYALANVRGE